MDGYHAAKKYHSVIFGTVEARNSVVGKRIARQEKNVPEPWCDGRDLFDHFMSLTSL